MLVGFGFGFRWGGGGLVRDTELKSNGEFPNSPVVRTPLFAEGPGSVSSRTSKKRPYDC